MIKILSVAETCRILNEHGMSITPERLRAGLQQGVYPFGVAIKLKEYCYEIYSNLLYKWVQERISEDVA